MIQMLRLFLMPMIVLLSMSLFCSQKTPTNPYDPANTTIKVFVKSSTGVINTTIITDTINDSIHYGVKFNYPLNVDSVHIETGFHSGSTGVFRSTIKDIDKMKYTDTLWRSFFLTDTGTMSIVVTAFVHGGITLSDTGTVVIISRPANHAPHLVISGDRALLPAQSCTLMVSAIDPDTMQTLKYYALSLPSGAAFNTQVLVFIWKSPDRFLGVDSAVFKVEDNGAPPLTDIQTVYINVSQPLQAPPSPDSLKKTDQVDGEPILSWQGSSAAENYIIYRANGNGQEFIAVDTVTDTVWKDSIGASVYLYFIKAINSAGSSASSDTIQAGFVDRPPKWQEDTLSLPVVVGSKVSLILRDKCSDPDSQSLSFVLFSGKPEKDTIVNGVYSLTPVAADTGRWWPKIAAKDPAGLLDTLTLKLTVTAPPPVKDTIAPVLYFMKPAKDTIVGVDSIAITIICKDASGIGSLIGYLDTFHFSMSKPSAADSVWTVNIKDLPSQYITVTFIAVDKSPAQNRDTVKIHIKYDSDTVAPSIAIVTPAKDSVSTNSSSDTVALKCSDASGIASVIGLLGTNAFPGAKGANNTWTIPITGLVANAFNTIAFTVTDGSLRANKATLTLHIKNDPAMAGSTR